jgi:hypothetical protein
MKLPSTLPPPALPVLPTAAEPRALLKPIAPRPDLLRSTPGALTFVPPSDPVAAKQQLQGFRVVAQKQGPVAAVESLAKNSGLVQSLIKTPAGRAALAAAVLGFTAGWAAGSNASKFQALATALKAVADQHLSAKQTAQQVGQVLVAALSPSKVAPPSSGREEGNKKDWQVSPKPTSLAQLESSLTKAKLALKEDQAILEQNPADPGQRELVQARQNSVTKLQGQVNAVRAQVSAGRSEVTPQSITQPKPVPKVPPLPSVSGASKSSIEDLPADLWKRFRDYGVGDKTREEALKGLTPEQRKRLERAIDELDKADKTPARPGSKPEMGGGGRLGLIKALRGWQGMSEAQRVADYQGGRSTREEALVGLKGKARERVAAALNTGGTAATQYDPLRLAEAINAQVKEHGSGLGLNAAQVREMEAALRVGLTDGLSATSHTTINKALAVLKQQSAIVPAPPASARGVDKPTTTGTNLDSVSALFHHGSAESEKNTEKALAVIPLLGAKKLDLLQGFLTQRAHDTPVNMDKVNAGVQAQRAQLEQPLSADQAKALVAQRFEPNMRGMSTEQRAEMVDKLRLVADLSSAQNDIKSPKLRDFLFELDRIQTDVQRQGTSGQRYADKKIDDLMNARHQGAELGEATRNAAKQNALLEYIKSRHPDVVSEIEQNRSMQGYTLASVVKLMHEFGGWGGNSGVQDFSKLAENARSNARWLASDAATRKPQAWKDAFEHYAKVNPSDAAAIKTSMASSRYSPEDVVRAAVRYPSSENADLRVVAHQMAQHTQANKVQLARNNVLGADIAGPIPDTDYFEGVRGDAKTRVHEMTDKSSRDLMPSNKPTKDTWLNLADAIVERHTKELPEIKAALLEIWRNGGQFNGPQLQIADLAKSFKSKPVHALVKTPSAADLLNEAKFLLKQAQAGKLGAKVQPMGLTDSDKLRASVIDYRFPEAPLQARVDKASLTADQINVQLTQARLAKLKQEGNLFYMRLPEMAGDLETRRSSAQAQNDFANAELAKQKNQHPDRTASNDPYVALMTARARASSLQLRFIHVASDFLTKAGRDLPAASAADVEQMFAHYAELLKATFTASKGEMDAIRQACAPAQKMSTFPQLWEFHVDPKVPVTGTTNTAQVQTMVKLQNVESARSAQRQTDALRLKYPPGDNRRPAMDGARQDALAAWSEAEEKLRRLGPQN